MAISKKKKRFFDVEIPLIRKTTQVYAMELKELEGRDLNYDLTRMLKGKNILASFKISVKDDTAIANPVRLKIMKTALKNFVRKGTDYIEDSFTATCKDSQVIIKPLLIARRKISRKVRKALRDKAREEIIEYTKDKTSQQIIEDLLKNNLQKPLSLKLKKIYPLALCEIRYFKVVKPIEISSRKKNVKEGVVEEVKKEKE